MTLEQKAAHLDPELRPKRILSLDGGGVRGMLTLAYLKRLEDLLRDRHDDPNLLLCDYFDLIGGTSTGAIIAASLASGRCVYDIKLLYERLAGEVFKRTWWRRGVLFAKYANRHLDIALKDEFHEYQRLSSGTLRTGLVVVTKRMDTGSPWVLTNHPRNKYWAAMPGKKRIGNGEFPLWRVIRASTAAPHYFQTEKLDVATEEIDGKTIVQGGEFIDGGVSTANNPALLLLQVATMRGFAFNWSLGDDQLLMVSVGTGRANSEIGAARGMRRLAAGHAGKALLGLLADCADHVETMMQWMSSSPTARSIDRQIGDLEYDNLAGEPLLTYLRYDVVFKRQWMKEELDLDQIQEDLDRLAKMDDATALRDLWELGNRAASRQIDADHLPAGFDLVTHPG